MSRLLDFDALEQFLLTHHRWQGQYRDAATIQERWDVVREIYAYYMPEILAASTRRRRGKINPYCVSWDFTPIERIAWHAIRCVGLPLYPQVPVARFFLDFANPYYKIGVELDGKAFHDPVKDTQRDLLLLQHGWRIFRIAGSECMLPDARPDDWEDPALPEQELARLHTWFLHTCEGVLTALDHFYFHDEPERWPHFEVAAHTLEVHRLVDFDLFLEGDC